MAIKTIKAFTAEIDIEAYRGDTFNKLFFRIRDLDDNDNQIPANIFGCKFALQIRPRPQASEVIAYFDNDFFVLGTSNEAIEYFTNLDPGNVPDEYPNEFSDEVHISIPASNMRFTAGRYYYDLEFKFADGDIFTPIKGRFNLIQDVTRDINYNT